MTIRLSVGPGRLGALMVGRGGDARLRSSVRILRSCGGVRSRSWPYLAMRQRQDVPGVCRNYVGGEEVDLVGAIGLGGGGVANIRAKAHVLGRFDLHAHEMTVMLDGKIVAG